MGEKGSVALRHFYVMVKPVGCRCNLNCTYCYYLDKERLLPGTPPVRMSDELLEDVIRQSIAVPDADVIHFTWHGGEPTLLGLDFFRRVIELQRKHAAGKQIENDLQTNGLLVNDAWCEFLREHRFLVGLSIDGPKHLNDCFRRTTDGVSSFDGAYRAAKLFQRHGVLFNTLTVISSVNVQHPDEVYDFLTDELGSRRLQWLPCVEPKDFRTIAPGRWKNMPAMGTSAARPGSPDSVVTDWSVDPDDWGSFLCRTFDLWLQKGFGRVLVNWFESAVGQWMKQPPEICTLAEVCGRAVAVEKDGGVYCCDHFVYPEYRLGSVSDGLVNLVSSMQQRTFGCKKAAALPNYCRRCPYCLVCYGECPKNRFIKTADGEPGLDYLCSGLRRFFAHADPHLRRIVLTPRSIIV